MQSYLISLMTLSISLFAVSALIVRPHRTQAHIFLCLVLLANAISYVWLVARGVGVLIVPLYRLDALEFLSGYLMLPALWFYAKALTTGAPVTWRRGYLWHAVPLGFAVLMVSILQIVPHDARMRLIDGPVPLNNLEFVAGFLLQADAFIFPVLLLGYVLVIVRRLSRHRSRLKDLYASTESRELTWINWMMVLFAVDWGLSVTSEISDISGAFSSTARLWKRGWIWRRSGYWPCGVCDSARHSPQRTQDWEAMPVSPNTVVRPSARTSV